MTVPRSGRTFAVAALASLLVAVSLAHYLTPTDYVLPHNIYQRLFYIPVLLAALRFGVRGGLACALVTLVAYAPHVFLQWGDHAAYRVNQLVEMPMFLVVGVLTGVLVDRERRLRRAAERTAGQRDEALRELRDTFDKMRRADRLSALGTLAASLAHEVRNPLGSIAGSVEILDREIAPDHPRREFVDILAREVERLSATTAKYLDFARPPAPERRRLDPVALVEEVVALVDKQAARQRIRIAKRRPRTPVTVVADPGLLRQAVLNLVINAVQAMPSGGELDVSVSVEDDRVQIAVRDHGPGVAAEQVGQIFEPFTTTKPGGTGLGLAVTRRIVEQHEGRLLHERPDDGGARFVVSLPRVEAAAHA